MAKPTELTKRPTKLVFFSEVNSKFGHPHLLELFSTPDVSVEGVVTSPEGKLCSYFVGDPEPVDLEWEARSRGVPVLRPTHVNAEEVVDELTRFEADYFLLANYQQILKARLLAVPSVATINFHPSPLPRYAGMAPFFWMTKNGEREGGVSAILVTEEIDGGPLIAQTPIALSGTETALELRKRHREESVSLLKKLIPRLVARDIPSIEQDTSKHTYYGNIGHEDLLIDWSEDTESVLRTIRAGYRFPGAYAVGESGEEVVVLSAERAENCQASQAEPGTVHETEGGVLVRTQDGWVRLLTIGVGEGEVEVGALTQPLLFSSQGHPTRKTS